MGVAELPNWIAYISIDGAAGFFNWVAYIITGGGGWLCHRHGRFT